jgi:hypothetical protein
MRTRRRRIRWLSQILMSSNEACVFGQLGEKLGMQRVVSYLPSGRYQTCGGRKLMSIQLAA